MQKLKIHHVDINQLKPSEYNPRKASEKQAEDLKESIKEFGLVDPIIVNQHEGRENQIIGGHFRIRIAKELGIKKVPVVYVNLPLEKEKELNLRLNRNLGGWDWDLLANFGDDLLTEVGFEENVFEKMFIDEFEDEIFEGEYAFGTINSWVRVGDFTTEIIDKKYQKIKKIIKKEGSLENLIIKIIKDYGEDIE